MRRTIAFALTCLACAACGDDELEQGPNPCNAEACDIREADCRESLHEVVLCFRGGDAGLPPIDVIDEDEYRELIEAARDEDAGVPAPDDDGGVAPDADESFERVLHGYSLINLAPDEIELEDSTADVLASIDASYLTRQGRIVVIDRGEALDSHVANVSLAHELVTALVHDEHDIEAIRAERPDTLDSRLALAALLEGEATHYELVVSAALVGVAPGGINWGALYTDWQLDELQGAYMDDYPVETAWLRVPYAFGGAYVTAVVGYDGQRGVDTIYDNPPRSTADVLTFSMLNAEPQAQADALAGVAVPNAPAGFALLSVDALGAFIYDQFLHRSSLTTARFYDGRANALIADYVSIFAADDDRTVVAWRLRFSDEASPTEQLVADVREAFDAPEEDAPPDGDDVRARVYAEDSDLVLVIGDHPLDPEWLAEDLVWVEAP